MGHSRNKDDAGIPLKEQAFGQVYVYSQGTSTWPGMCVQPWLHIEHAFEAENAEQVAGARRSLKDSTEDWESHSAERAAQKGQLEQWWVLAQGKEQEHPLQPTRGVSNSGGAAQGV